MSRRHVFRVLAIYVAAGWGFTEIVQGVVEQVGGPQAIATFITIAFIVGFPIVLFLAWMFDVDKHGVHRVPTRRKGQMLVSLAIAALLSASYAIYRYVPRDADPAGYEPPDDVVLAVLPFRNLSTDDELAILSKAIAEDLLNGVAVIPELRVKASFSSFSLEGQEPSVFAEKLGVNHLLDGTYRVEDDTIRISARLIDTDSADVVWTRVLTDSLSNILQIENQIAIDIASALGLPHPDSALDTSRQIDPDVYRLYLQARQGYANPWQDTENTILKIRQVLELEPNFPEALMMMGFLDTGRAWVMENRQAPWLKTGEEYSLRALEIDPNLSEAYAVLALNYALQYRWAESREMADKAVEVAGPRPLNVVYTLPYNNLGHTSTTQEILERMFEQDPLNPRAVQGLIGFYGRNGEYEKALQLEQLAIENGYRYQRSMLINAYVAKGDLETAEQLVALWLQDFGLPAAIAPQILKGFATGRSEEFEHLTDQAIEAGQLPVGQAIWNYTVAGAPADKVYALVEAAIPDGKYNQISLMSPLATAYRQDPRFLEIYSGLGLIDYWKTVQLPGFCDSEQIQGLCE